MTIRKATLKDIPALLALWREFMHDHDDIVFKKNQSARILYRRKTDAAALMRKFFEKNIRGRNSIVFIAEEGVPIGYLLGIIQSNVPVYRIKHLAHLNDLFLQKPYRGKGVASLLEKTFVDWARDKGIHHLRIRVSAYNDHAHAVYQNWDFTDFKIEMMKKI